MSYMKNIFEDRMQSLADETGYDIEFLMEQWNSVCKEAAEDGEKADWDQFCSIAREQDW